MNKKELELKEPELVWEYIKDLSPGYFVEVGANDPFSLSQTWHLEQKGWKGVLVEPLPERADALRKNRPNSQVFQVACGSPENVGEIDFYIGEADQLSSLEKYVDDPNVNYVKTIKVKVMTLDSILDEAKISRVDFVSIDTEGTELDVLKGFSLNRWKPKLLLIEDKIHSLKKHFYLKKQNYKLVRRTGLNNWYIPVDAQPPKIDAWEKFEIIRKMYLATPHRVLRLYLKRLSSKKQK
ncbi:MAG TPA: FkbM family methyltransferase [Verrucomicrobiota bacterium]|nr:FkbM family methyltransferase [Verrucomicrobiota bacterium]